MPCFRDFIPQHLALTPLVIHPSQPFPFFSNRSLSLAFILHDESRDEVVNARVKVPAELAQWVPVSIDVPPGERVFVRLHEVIRENAQKLYPGMRLTSPTLFRLTRDADLEMPECRVDLGGSTVRVREMGSASQAKVPMSPSFGSLYGGSLPMRRLFDVLKRTAKLTTHSEIVARVSGTGGLSTRVIQAFAKSLDPFDGWQGWPVRPRSWRS